MLRQHAIQAQFRQQAAAGPEYSYFMVFKNRNFGLDGAYTVEQFAEILKEL